jgi:hypothetical protein
MMHTLEIAAICYNDRVVLTSFEWKFLYGAFAKVDNAFNIDNNVINWVV